MKTENVLLRNFGSKFFWRIIFLLCLLANSTYAFNIGDKVETTATVNVRSTAAGTSVGTQSSGVIGTITAGPTTASLGGTSYTWYNITFPSSPNGWVATVGLESAPPTVTTVAASAVTATSATLNSTVYPNSSSTTIYFQYGTTTSYGNTTSSGNIGTTSGPYGFSISGLSANTIYHFRIVAYNGTGLSPGNDSTFTTLTQPLPNLTLTQPSGWSDAIIVSRTAISTTDSTSLTTADTLYVNAAVINNGAAATAANFNNELYVDGVPTGNWVTAAPLNVNSYSFLTSGYPIGQLSAGTHTIKITADYGGVIVESNEGDNSYTKTITVGNPSLPNLTPTQPSGWSDAIIVSRTAISTTDSTSLTTADTLYVNAAVINNGAAPTAANFNNELYVDGVPTDNWVTSAPLNVNSYSALTSGYPIGQLSTGTHTIKITADYGGVIVESNEGDNSYTKTITVGSSQGSTVSASLSTLTVMPSSAVANGTSTIVATVTLRDGNNNPVAGKTVNFYSGNKSIVHINPPTNPTDVNGQATATMTANTPISTYIYAVDVTDSTVISQETNIQFTSGFVLPGAALSNAIVQLGNSSRNLLTTSIAGFAVDDGGYGDYFYTQIPADEREEGIDALATGIKGLLTILLPGTDDPFYAVGESLRDDLAENDVSGILAAVAEDSTGLTMAGQNIANSNGSLQQSQFQAEQSLLAGVLPVTANYANAYANDISLRIGANLVLSNILSSQSQVLMGLHEDSELSQDNSDLLAAFFTVVNYVPTVAGTLIDSPKVLDAGFDLAELPSTFSANQQTLGINRQAYNTTVVSLDNCAYLSKLIDENTKSAYTVISQGQPPNPITGKIVSVNSVITYTPLSGIIGTLEGWFGDLVGVPDAVNITGAYSLVTVTNSNAQAALFSVNAFYEYVTTVQNQFGITTEGTPFPMSASAITNIPANQSLQIRINYFDGTQGAIPDALPISFNVLGYDGNNGIFAVDQASSTIEWQSTEEEEVSNAKFKSNGASPNDGSATNLYAIINPIQSAVTQNPSNQTYQAQIWVANPFAIPLLATVTQPLPTGITVLTTDGTLGSSSIVWTNTIVTNGLVEETFSFNLPMTPGVQTNLPTPTLVFSDATGTNSLSLQAVAANFKGLFPVSVNGFVPNGVSGTDSPMQVTVTNLTGTSETGSLNISLADNTGNIITNFNQTFSVNGLVGASLNFTLPGTLPLGSYSLSGSLTMNGGTGQVLAGVYVVSPMPVTLGAASPVLSSTNGFGLMLQGPISSNYVIEASTDLFNWTPAIYFSSTNSPFYFSDPSATNFSQRFYRAVMP